MKAKTKKIKNAFYITIDDAIKAALRLVEQEHPSEPLCKKCHALYKLLKTTRQKLNQIAIGNNLVLYALKGERRIDITHSKK